MESYRQSVGRSMHGIASTGFNKTNGLPVYYLTLNSWIMNYTTLFCYGRYFVSGDEHQLVVRSTTVRAGMSESFNGISFR